MQVLLVILDIQYFNNSKNVQKAMSSGTGAGSAPGKKILAAEAAPKQAGSETLVDNEYSRYIGTKEGSRKGNRQAVIRK